MPSRKRRLKYRPDSLDPVDALELSIGGPSEQLCDLWHRHGAHVNAEEDR